MRQVHSVIRRSSTCAENVRHTLVVLHEHPEWLTQKELIDHRPHCPTDYHRLIRCSHPECLQCVVQTITSQEVLSTVIDAADSKQTHLAKADSNVELSN